MTFVALSASADVATERVEDVDALCGFVRDEYAYFDANTAHWDAACTSAREAAPNAVSRDDFVGLLERTLDALHDFHAHLGTSNRASPKLVPTDTDVDAEWRGDRAVIVDVRPRSAALAAGVRPGMVVLQVDGRPVAETRTRDPDTRRYALNRAIAGRQDGVPTTLVVDDRGTIRSVAYRPGVERSDAPVQVRHVGRVAVIRIDNALGDPRTVADFDRAIDALAGTTGLVLDLRDTPSGGTSSVARGIMGRLVAREAPYQRHERVSEARETGVRRVWVEYVEPRGKPFRGKVVVLVGRWTGSMGEGIAIGLNAARGAPVVGQPMAHLLGALDELRLPHSGIVVRIPTEKLFHVDGTPREAFVPRPLPRDPMDDDVEVAAAIRMAAQR